jgi:hypothetical protein
MECVESLILFSHYSPLVARNPVILRNWWKWDSDAGNTVLVAIGPRPKFLTVLAVC